MIKICNNRRNNTGCNHTISCLKSNHAPFGSRLSSSPSVRNGNIYFGYIGFFIQGIINNSLLIMITINSYKLTEIYHNKYIHAGSVVLLQQITGLLIQMIYPHIMSYINTYFKVILLYMTVILACITLLVYDKLSNYLIILCIVILTINSYFGEIFFISNVSKYAKKNFSYWTIGTGLCGIMTNGLYLVYDHFFPINVIYIILCSTYVILITLSFILIKFSKENIDRKNFNKINEITDNNINEITDINKVADDEIELLEVNKKIDIELDNNWKLIDLDNSENTNSTPTVNDSSIRITEDKLQQKIINDTLNRSKIGGILNDYFKIFSLSSPLWLESFFRYFINIVAVPYLSKTAHQYEVLFFCGSIGVFLGKLFGTFYLVTNIYYYNLVHIYNIVFIIVVFVFYNEQYYYILIPFVTLANIICSSCYPQVYNTILNDNEIQEKSLDHRDKQYYMSLVCQFSTFTTIIAASLSFII